MSGMALAGKKQPSHLDDIAHDRQQHHERQDR